MAFNLGVILPYIMRWIVSPAMWLVIILIFVGGAFGILKFRKWRNYKYRAIEVTEYGLNTNIKCGWFGVEKLLFGLWWRGREIMETDLGEEIIKFSEEDFIEIDGKRNILFYRDPINRRLFPIRYLVPSPETRQIVAKVPPAEHTEAVLSNIDESKNETKDLREKIILYAVIGGVIIFALVSIILMIQFIKNSQDKANTLFLEAGKSCLESAKSVCSQISSSTNKPPITSTAP